MRDRIHQSARLKTEREKNVRMKQREAEGEYSNPNAENDDVEAIGVVVTVVVHAIVPPRVSALRACARNECLSLSLSLSARAYRAIFSWGNASRL